ncbi:MAG: hypothetical protein K2I92_01945 [Muribaculaceae bacterium]|nr:hypothetical protein [Muribaculaceae bacterium]
MIVPDFGVGAEDEAMAALKKAIESRGEYAVKIIDLPAIVRAEHEGEELTESKVIELAARKLEQLASCNDLVRDVSDNVETRNEHPEEDEDEEKFYLCKIGNELKVVDEYEYIELMREFSDSIDIESDDCECGEPNAVIVFGKSAMLAGGLGRKKVAECDYTLPLERIHTRRDLNALRDAIVRAGELRRNDEPDQKRILIVPDYFTPYNAPIVKELYRCLKGEGYYVAVYVHGNTLEKSRQGIERRCRVKPFDLIVTLETGCLVATRITNCPRIFVNPDWTAWECMKRLLGDSRERLMSRKDDNNSPFFTYYLNRNEVEMARRIAERANIKRGKELIYGWFSTDADPELSEEHLKRFSTAIHIPHFKITTDGGAILAQDIHNILSLEDD